MRKIKPVKGEAAYVVWQDSSILGGWVYDLRPSRPKEIQTIGFIADVGDEALTITCGRSETGGVIAPLIIPFSCIVDYKPLAV